MTVNYARYVVDIALGYYLGTDVKYDPNPQSWSEAPSRGLLGRRALDITPLLACYDRQHIGQVDREIGKTMGVMGDCLELCYASCEANPPPQKCPD